MYVGELFLLAGHSPLLSDQTSEFAVVYLWPIRILLAGYLS